MDTHAGQVGILSAYLASSKGTVGMICQLKVLVPGSLFIGYLLFPLQGFVWLGGPWDWQLRGLGRGHGSMGH